MEAAEAEAAGTLGPGPEADPFPIGASPSNHPTTPPSASASAAARRLQRSKARCTPRPSAAEGSMSPPTSADIASGAPPGHGGGSSSSSSGGGGGGGGAGSSSGGAEGGAASPTATRSALDQLHSLAQWAQSQVGDLAAALNTIPAADRSAASDTASDAASRQLEQPSQQLQQSRLPRQPGSSPTLYEVSVPRDVQPGGSFHANLGGQLMLVTCPAGYGPGSLIQVQVGSPLPIARARRPGAGNAGGAAASTPAPQVGRGDWTPRTAAVLEASRREQKALEELGGLFPALPPTELRAVLERLGWDVNEAACELIDVGLHH